MSRIYIVEGPDGAGKTTLVHALSRHTGLPTGRVSPPFAAGTFFPTHYIDLILQAARGPGMIFDRFSLSEVIYGPLLRGQDRLGLEALRVTEWVQRQHQVRHIMCLPNFETCFDVWAPRALAKNELVTDPLMYARVWNQYEHWSRALDGITIYNRNKESLRDVTQRLARRAA